MPKFEGYFLQNIDINLILRELILVTLVFLESGLSYDKHKCK